MHLRHYAFLLFCGLLPLHGKDHPPLSPALIGSLRKSGLPPAAESVSIPLSATIYGAFTVEARINGKPVQLILDMGASCTDLSPEVARSLGLQATERRENVASGTGEQVIGRRALTERLSLGEAWTENEPVFVSEMIPGIDGLLGVGTLADWDVQIDPSTKKLTLFPAEKAPSLEGETVLPLTCRVVSQ